MVQQAALLASSSDLETAESDRGSLRRVILASSLGAIFESYDLVLYGPMAAIIAAQFFSGLDVAYAYIFTLLSAAVSYVARPFGGLVFGPLGDIAGRKYTFLLTIMVMGTSTVVIGKPPWRLHSMPSIARLSRHVTWCSSRPSIIVGFQPAPTRGDRQALCASRTSARSCCRAMMATECFSRQVTSWPMRKSVYSSLILRSRIGFAFTEPPRSFAARLNCTLFLAPISSSR